MRGLLRVVREKLSERGEIRARSLKKVPEDTFKLFPGQWHSAAERYRRGESQVWVWLRERRVIEGDRDYLVVFDRLSRESHPHVLDAGIADDCISGGVGPANDGGRCDELSVFVEDVQVRQVVEDLPHAVGLHSVVRLYLLDHAECFWGNATGNPQRLCTPYERDASGGLAGPDGEVGVGSWLASVGNNELPGQMIKGASEIVDTIPCNESPSVVVSRRMISPEDVLRSVVLDLGDESIGITFDSSIEIPLEFVEMDIRTLDLDVNAVERGDLPAPLATHSLPLEEDAQAERPQADTGNGAQRGSTSRNPHPDAGRGLP